MGKCNCKKVYYVGLMDENGIPNGYTLRLSETDMKRLRKKLRSSVDTNTK